ncbi:MAG: hypothetical protein L0Z62_43925, partial [Gemmataceae bacterium]|nr:hypothetical protein [Gemmataceae bacterium]
MALSWLERKGIKQGTGARLSKPRRARTLQVERLEERLTPSWTSMPPATITPPTSFVPAILNSQGDATGSAAITGTEIDWYRFTSALAGSYVFQVTTLTSTVDTVIGLYSAAGSRLGSNDDMSFTNPDSRFTINLAAGQTVFFGVTNYVGTAGGAYTWRIEGPGATPADDAFEENDTRTQARDLGTVTAPRTITGLVMADAH